MQRGGASVAVEKIEQASSAKIFSGTARRQGLRFAEEWAAEEILDQVGSRLAAGRGLLDIKICMPTRQGIVCGRLRRSGVTGGRRSVRLAAGALLFYEEK